MTWIIVNFFFFALNLFFAITGTYHGWIVWSAFCSGLSFGIFVWATMDWMYENGRH